MNNEQKKSHFPIISFVMGCLSWTLGFLVPFIFPIAGLVFSIIVMRNKDQYEKLGLNLAGFILCALSLVFSLIGLLFLGAIIATL